MILELCIGAILLYFGTTLCIVSFVLSVLNKVRSGQLLSFIVVQVVCASVGAHLFGTALEHYIGR